MSPSGKTGEGGGRLRFGDELRKFNESGLHDQEFGGEHLSREEKLSSLA
jgi:hypothetical protein